MCLTVFNYRLQWQYFETDDPEFYKTKVCFILKNDVSEMDLVFAEEKYNKSGQLEKVIRLSIWLLYNIAQILKKGDKCFYLKLV